MSIEARDSILAAITIILMVPAWIVILWAFYRLTSFLEKLKNKKEEKDE